MSAQLPLMPDDLEPLLEDLNVFPRRHDGVRFQNK